MSDRLRAAQEALEAARRGTQTSRDVPNLLEPESWQEPKSPPKGWKADALEQLRELARERQSFTVEDLRPRVGPTVDYRALGAVLTAGARKGWIRAAGWVPGGRERHSRPIREWLSQIHEGGKAA